MTKNKEQQNLENDDDHRTNNDSMDQSSKETTTMLSSSPKSVVVTETPSSPPLLPQHQHPTVQDKDDDPILLAVATTTSVDDWSVISPSSKSLRTRNPIRAIVDPIIAQIYKQQQEHDNEDTKPHISLALGDPTASGNLSPCPVAIEAIIQTLQQQQSNSSNNKHAGYVNACGTIEARTAIAKYHSCIDKKNTISSADDVIIANGCSGALELAITSLLDDENSTLLVPKPGFPLYQVIAESHGASVLHYNLLPNDSWKVDLQQLRDILNKDYKQNNNACNKDKMSNNKNKKIAGIVINNPSNPTGAVYSKEHLLEIVQICTEYHIPIITDEIYGDLVFDNNVFYPLAHIVYEAGQQVPIITTSGIGKQFLLPGWRVGWIIFQDNVYGSLREVKAGAKRLAQVILGASHLTQIAVPALLNQNDNQVIQWKNQLRTKLQEQAMVLCNELYNVPGLHVIQPNGAMYAMVCIDMKCFLDIENDLDFTTKLLQEENVFVLPGKCFNFPNTFRIVFGAQSIPILKDAGQRIRNFCHKHCFRL